MSSVLPLLPLLERRRSLFFPLPKLCILIALLSLVFVVPMRFRTLGAGRPSGKLIAECLPANGGLNGGLGVRTERGVGT
jgi:hypothetical protein